MKLIIITTMILVIVLFIIRTIIALVYIHSNSLESEDDPTPQETQVENQSTKEDEIL